jgi:glutamine amidotransferase
MSATRVAIIDSGGANIASLVNAFDRLGVGSELTSDTESISNASHVVLPGVGNAADAMQRLTNSQLAATIKDLDQPVLGVCLGMQLMLESSAENDTPCLGILPGSAGKLRVSPTAPVPNMGWCRVDQQNEHTLFNGIPSGTYFYFAHSYAMSTNENTLASADHTEPFSAVVQRNNFVGAQFHPERSAKAGARFLRNFLELAS